MHDDRRLPAPPAISISVVADHSSTARAMGGFLDVRRVELSATYPDGETSRPFPYDVGSRELLDAVCFAVHFMRDDMRHVYLRTAVRPPIALRPIPPQVDANVWEVPAGLIDPGETPEEAAAREIGEELGFSVRSTELRELGPWMFPVPAVIGERHVFFHVEVDPDARATPEGDGSPLERCAEVRAVPVLWALDECRRGVIRDTKSELALRRLLELS